MDKLEEIKKKYRNPNENIGWLISEVEQLREENKKLRSDVSDIHGSVQTTFKRCSKCGHLSDENYECSYCNKH